MRIDVKYEILPRHSSPLPNAGGFPCVCQSKLAGVGVNGVWEALFQFSATISKKEYATVPSSLFPFIRQRLHRVSQGFRADGKLCNESEFKIEEFFEVDDKGKAINKDYHYSGFPYGLLCPLVCELISVEVCTLELVWISNVDRARVPQSRGQRGTYYLESSTTNNRKWNTGGPGGGGGGWVEESPIVHPPAGIGFTAERRCASIVYALSAGIAHCPDSAGRPVGMKNPPGTRATIGNTPGSLDVKDTLLYVLNAKRKFDGFDTDRAPVIRGGGKPTYMQQASLDSGLLSGQGAHGRSSGASAGSKAGQQAHGNVYSDPSVWRTARPELLASMELRASVPDAAKRVPSDGSGSEWRSGMSSVLGPDPDLGPR